MAKGKIYHAPQIKRLEDFKLKRPSTSTKTTEDFVRESTNRFFSDDEAVKNSPRALQEKESELYNETPRFTMPEIYEMSDYDPDEVYEKKRKRADIPKLLKNIVEFKNENATVSGKNRVNSERGNLEFSRGNPKNYRNINENKDKPFNFTDFRNATDPSLARYEDMKPEIPLIKKKEQNKTTAVGRAIKDIPRNLLSGTVNTLENYSKVATGGLYGNEYKPRERDDWEKMNLKNDNPNKPKTYEEYLKHIDTLNKGQTDFANKVSSIGSEVTSDTTMFEKMVKGAAQSAPGSFIGFGLGGQAAGAISMMTSNPIIVESVRTLPMFSTATVEGLKQAEEMGLTGMKKYSYGVFSGLIESAWERASGLGLEGKLLGKKTAGATGGAKEYLLSLFTEAATESMTEISTDVLTGAYTNFEDFEIDVEKAIIAGGSAMLMSGTGNVGLLFDGTQYKTVGHIDDKVIIQTQDGRQEAVSPEVIMKHKLAEGRTARRSQEILKADAEMQEIAQRVTETENQATIPTQEPTMSQESLQENTEPIAPIKEEVVTEPIKAKKPKVKDIEDLLPQLDADQESEIEALEKIKEKKAKKEKSEAKVELNEEQQYELEAWEKRQQETKDDAMEWKEKGGVANEKLQMANSFKASAERRKIIQGDSLELIEGGLTPTELSNRKKFLNSNYLGKKVKTPLGNGKVLQTPFGRVQVELESGKVVNFEKSEVEGLDAPKYRSRERAIEEIQNTPVPKNLMEENKVEAKPVETPKLEKKSESVQVESKEKIAEDFKKLRNKGEIDFEATVEPPKIKTIKVGDYKGKATVVESQYANGKYKDGTLRKDYKQFSGYSFEFIEGYPITVVKNNGSWQIIDNTASIMITSGYSSRKAAIDTYVGSVQKMHQEVIDSGKMKEMVETVQKDKERIALEKEKNTSTWLKNEIERFEKSMKSRQPIKYEGKFYNDKLEKSDKLYDLESKLSDVILDEQQAKEDRIEAERFKNEEIAFKKELKAKQKVEAPKLKAKETETIQDSDGEIYSNDMSFDEQKQKVVKSIQDKEDSFDETKVIRNDNGTVTYEESVEGALDLSKELLEGFVTFKESKSKQTLTEATGVSEYQKENFVKPNPMKYETTTNEIAGKKAYNRVMEDYAKAFNDVTYKMSNKNQLDPTDIATIDVLLLRADEIYQSNQDTTYLDNAERLLDSYWKYRSDMGKSFQALSIIKRLSREGSVYLLNKRVTDSRTKLDQDIVDVVSKDIDSFMPKVAEKETEAWVESDSPRKKTEKGETATKKKKFPPKFKTQEIEALLKMLESYKPGAKFIREINAILNERGMTKQEILDKFYIAKKIPNITQENRAKLTEYLEKARNAEIDSREYNINMNAASDIVSRASGTNFWKQLRSARIMGMLSSPRTGIRNETGNTGTGLGIKTLESGVESRVDRAIAKKTGQRTVANKVRVRHYVKGLIEGYKISFDDLIKGTDSRTVQGKLLGMKEANFKKGGFLDKASKYIAFNTNDFRSFNAHMAQMDYAITSAIAEMRAKNQTFGEIDMEGFDTYEQAYENHLMESEFIMREVFKDKAMEYTFNNNTWSAQLLADIVRKLDEKTPFTGDDFGIGSILVAFARTPMNLVDFMTHRLPLASALPTGVDLANQYRQQLKAPKVNRKSVLKENQNKIVTVAGRQATGFMLTGLGMMMGAGGWITNDEEDEKVGRLLAAQGINGSYLNLDAMKRWLYAGGGLMEPYEGAYEDGDTLISFNWALPISPFLLLGARLNQKFRQNKDVPFVSSAIEALGDSTGDFFELPFVRGLQTLFSSNIDGWGDKFGKIGNDLVIGFIPSLLKQAATTEDPNAKNTRYLGKGALSDNVRQNLPTVKIGDTYLIKGRKTLPNRLDILGNKMEYYEPTVFNKLFSFVNPSYGSTVDYDKDASKIIKAFRDGDIDGLPVMKEDSFSYKEISYALDEEQHAYFRKRYIYHFANSKSPMGLTFNSRYATEEAKQEVLSKYPSLKNQAKKNKK